MQPIKVQHLEPVASALPPKWGVRGGRVGFTAQRQPSNEVPLQGVSNIKSMACPSLLGRFPQHTKLFLPFPSKRPCTTRAKPLLRSLTGEPGHCCCGAEGGRRSQKHGTDVRQQTLRVMAEELSGATQSPSWPRFSRAKQDGAGKTAFTDIRPFNVL